MIHIFYHKVDLDGYASGAITRFYFTNGTNEEVKMWPINYDQDILWKEFGEQDKIYLVDFHLHPKDFDKLDRVFILDHHESFLKELDGRKYNGRIEIGKAACLICWEHFFPKNPVPKWIKLLSDYDIWKKGKNWDTEVIPFQLRMKMENPDPAFKSEFWAKWIWSSLLDPQVIKKGREDKNYATDINELTNRYIEEGRILVKYQKSTNGKHLDMYSFESKAFGLNAICMNTPVSNSQAFESKWDPDKHDIMVRFVYNGESYEVSLYTTKDIDVSQLAVKMGGGGHKQAAGFYCSEIYMKDGELNFVKI